MVFIEKIFFTKVVAIEEVRDIDDIRLDEAYEMNLLQAKRDIGTALKSEKIARMTCVTTPTMKSYLLHKDSKTY